MPARRPATSEPAGPVRLADPSKAITQLLNIVAAHLANELINEELGGWADQQFHKRAADEFFNDLYEAVVHCEVERGA